MSRFNTPNKADLRQSNTAVLNALQAHEEAINRIADQANVDPTGAEVSSPPPVSLISVKEAGGIHDIQIQDQTPAYRALQYSAWYSQNPDMSNAHRIDLGESQNHRANLGSGKYYWAATSKYSSSDHSPMVYHGGTTPQAVGSGNYSGPPMQDAQGFTGKYRAAQTPPVRA